MPNSGSRRIIPLLALAFLLLSVGSVYGQDVAAGEPELADVKSSGEGSAAAEKERRIRTFLGASITFDDNIFSSGNPLADESDIVATAIAGSVFTAKVNEGQQKYTIGGQLKLKAYADNDDLTDYEADIHGGAAFNLNRVQLSFNDRFSRSFEPSDILADRAPRLVNTASASAGYDGDAFDIHAGFQHSRRDEEEAKFAALEHTDIRYGLDATYELNDDFSIGASVWIGELDYDFDITADSYKHTHVSGIIAGRLGNSGIRYSARLGAVIIDDESAIDDDATNLLAAVQANWLSPDKANQFQISFTSDVYPSTVVSFEVVSRTRVEYRRKFTQKVSGDISIGYEDSDRGDLVADPTRFTVALGGTLKIKKLHEAYISIGQVTKTSRGVNDDYDRLEASLGVNFRF